MAPPKRTILYAEHQKLGARMTNFAGFEMPVQYSGIIEEHMTVRTAAGVFDLSHMGEFEVAADPYYVAEARDKLSERVRKVFVFRLVPVS